MWVAFAFLALARTQPGPLDAFRANYSSIKVELEFDFTVGDLKEPVGRLRLGQQPNYVENPDTRLTGRWACDGRVEYFNFSSPEDVLERASKDTLRQESNKVYFNIDFVPKSEFLWDGELLCGHIEHPHKRRSGGDPDWKVITAEVPERELGYLQPGRGPFHWGFSAFPYILKAFGQIEPKRHKALRGGRPTEVEIYERETSAAKDFERVEVSYDPSVGYLPRVVRGFAYFKAGDVASVREIYMMEARPCKAGGFIPTDWYQVSFFVHGFQARFPNYNEETDISPPASEVGMSHFRTLNFKDITGPVALKELAGVHSVMGVGGGVARPSSKSTLTIRDIRSLLGKKLTTPQTMSLRNIDSDELHELDQTSSGWRAFLIAAAAAVVVAWLFLFWRKRRKGIAAALLLVCLAGLSGCGKISRPVLKITAAYEKPVAYIDPSTHELPMTMVVRNEGNQDVRVLKIDGGCTCRKVDESNLPVVVKPGKGFVAQVKMSISPNTSPQYSPFALETDHGVVRVVAPFYTLVSHQFQPDSASNVGIYEDGDWTFGLVHRAIYKNGPSRTQFELKFPAEFGVQKGAVVTGSVGGSADYSYEEATLHPFTQGSGSRGAQGRRRRGRSQRKDSARGSPGLEAKPLPFIRSRPGDSGDAVDSGVSPLPG